MANEYTNLTITLTGHPPVKIHKADWPIIAQAQDGEQVPDQNWYIRVRKHADGRMIIYATYNLQAASRHQRGIDIREGELLQGEGALPSAITRIAKAVASRCEALGHTEAAARMRELGYRCIADLPAVEA
jgi:hypothetical protein